MRSIKRQGLLGMECGTKSLASDKVPNIAKVQNDQVLYVILMGLFDFYFMGNRKLFTRKTKRGWSWDPIHS